MTRDRVSYDATWNGRAFTVVDTGGWDPDARGLAEAIRAQAEIAVTLADAVLFVVDATVGITDADEAVVKILRKSGKPVVLAANKVDDQRTEAEAYGLWNLGLGEPYPVSALHGRGSGDMLDAVLAALPEPPPERTGEVGGPRRIAIVGKPNVGKSSLLNKLAGADRVVVDNVAGTTVDPVDELIELGGRTWRFIDTAGIRKRVKEASGHEYYASLRTTTAIDRAEVAVLVVDGGQSISEQDVRIIQTVREAGRALVIAFNKWDLVDEERRYYLEREIERDLVQVQWAPRINITARTGWHVDRLVPALEKAIEGWETRISTGALNASSAGSSPSTPTRCAAASSPRCSSAPRPRPRRRRSCCSRAASSTRPTSATSSVGCARSSASSVRRSCCSSGRGRSASGSGAPARAVLVLGVLLGVAAPASAGPADDPRRAGASRWRGRRARRSPPTTTGTPTSGACRGTAAAPSGSRTCRPAGTCIRTSARRTARGRTTASP